MAGRSARRAAARWGSVRAARRDAIPGAPRLSTTAVKVAHHSPALDRRERWRAFQV